MPERANEMITATATEYRFSTGNDFTPADAFDAACLGVEAAGGESEDVDLMSVAERQTLNARMAEWYGVG